MCCRSLQDIFGCHDHKGDDWRDGALVKLLRKFISDRSNKAISNTPCLEKSINVLMLDAELSTSGSDHFLALLEQGRILTLGNGERLRVPKHMCPVFETTNLTRASPSFIARCNIVYVEKPASSWDIYCASLLQSLDHLSKVDAEDIRDFIDLLFERVLSFCAKNHVHLDEVRIMSSCFRLLDCFILYSDIDSTADTGSGSSGTHTMGGGGTTGAASGPGSSTSASISSTSTSNKKHRAINFESILSAIIMSTIWTFGEEVRMKSSTGAIGIFRSVSNSHNFSALQQVKAHLKPTLETTIREIAVGQSKRLHLPQCSLYQCYFNEAMGKLFPLSQQDNEDRHILSLSRYDSLFVQTPDFVRVAYRTTFLAKRKISANIIGSPASGKTSYLQAMHEIQLRSGIAALCVSLTASSKAGDVRRQILAKLHRRRQNVLAPPAGKILTVLIDDINLNSLQYASGESVNDIAMENPLEMLRYLLGSSSTFSDRTSTFMTIEDVGFVCTSSETHYEDCSEKRLQRFLHHFRLPSIGAESLQQMFCTKLRHAWGAEIEGEAAGLIEALGKATAAVYRSAQNVFHASLLDPVHEMSVHDSFKALLHLKRFSSAQALSAKNTIWLCWAHECVRSFTDSCRVHNLGRPQSKQAIDTINAQIERTLQNETGNSTSTKDILFTHLQAAPKPFKKKANGTGAGGSISISIHNFARISSSLLLHIMLHPLLLLLKSRAPHAIFSTTRKRR